ncbi:MAG: hypothetical protein R2771_07860 [Saprospiraceae bacterium]
MNKKQIRELEHILTMRKDIDSEDFDMVLVLLKEFARRLPLWKKLIHDKNPKN